MPGEVTEWYVTSLPGASRVPAGWVITPVYCPEDGVGILRTKDCREKIESAAKACNLEEETVRQVKRSIGISDQFKESFGEISQLATMTVLELGKKENKAVLDKVIPELKKRMAGGSRPTKREVSFPRACRVRL